MMSVKDDSTEMRTQDLRDVNRETSHTSERLVWRSTWRQGHRR